MVLSIIIDTASSFSCWWYHTTIGFLTKFEIKSILPVHWDGFVYKPEVRVDKSEYQKSSLKQNSSLQVVKLIMEVIHLIGVFLGVKLMRWVEDEPLSGFEHSTEEIQIDLKGEFEIFRIDECTFPELFVFG